MSTERDLAALYMDVVPKAMREFRKDVRGGGADALTVPQYRILAFLDYDEANNSELAEQHGVSVAAMSRMVDGLCDRGLVERKQNPGDRRMVKVQLTRKGREHFARFRRETQSRLQKRLAALDDGAKRDLDKGLAALAYAVLHMRQSI
jgi:DNA-binding MarR family transcriptional regulator